MKYIQFFHLRFHSFDTWLIPRYVEVDLHITLQVNEKCMNRKCLKSTMVALLLELLQSESARFEACALTSWLQSSGLASFQMGRAALKQVNIISI